MMVSIVGDDGIRNELYDRVVISSSGFSVPKELGELLKRAAADFGQPAATLTIRFWDMEPKRISELRCAFLEDALRHEGIARTNESAVGSQPQLREISIIQREDSRDMTAVALAINTLLPPLES